MATSAKSHMQEWMTAAMFRYTEELPGYAGLQQSAPDRPNRSVRFECREAPSDDQVPAAAPQTCWLPGRGKVCRGETIATLRSMDRSTGVYFTPHAG